MNDFLENVGYILLGILGFILIIPVVILFIILLPILIVFCLLADAFAQLWRY